MCEADHRLLQTGIYGVRRKGVSLPMTRYTGRYGERTPMGTKAMPSAATSAICGKSYMRQSRMHHSLSAVCERSGTALRLIRNDLKGSQGIIETLCSFYR